MDRRTPQCALAIALIAAAGCQPASPSVDGHWTVASATLGGANVPAEAFQGSALELTAGRYVFQNDTGTYRVMADSVPAAIDVVGVAGPNAGKTFPSIFALQGDTLTICYDMSGAARPKEFVSAPGTRIFLAKYVRSKP